MTLRAPVAVFTVATLVKILLIPAYRSTDFEVHRNWLAITHSLPLSKWYYEDTSEWTLDYPPFFAWFEWALSQFAVLVDPLIVQLQSLNYSAKSCVLFQRVSVILSDLVLFYGVCQYCSYHQKKRSSTDKTTETNKHTLVISILLLFNYGLLVVDHIHFQYNGFLFGILVLSLTRVLQGRYLEGAFFFAALLNFKHIFLYISPAFFVYLLKHYCFSRPPTPSSPAPTPSSPANTPSSPAPTPSSPASGGKIKIQRVKFLPLNFLKLGLLVALVFLVSFGPFLQPGMLKQVISRLFPFKRGLCHAYWAPNVWALYSVADKFLAVIGTRLGFLSPSSVGVSSMTSGLVGEMQFQVLPAIPPWVAMVTTLLAMLPALLWLWRRRCFDELNFLKAVILCAYGSFLFGWHVHEKAVMMIILPLCLLVVEDTNFTQIFFLLSMAGHISLFPLLFQPAETSIKVTLFVLCTTVTFIALHFILGHSGLLDSPTVMPLAHTPSSDHLSPDPSRAPTSLSSPKSSHISLSWFDMLYFFLLLTIQFYCLFVHGLFGFLSRLEFLPLLLTSVSCAVGVVRSWVLFYSKLL